MTQSRKNTENQTKQAGSEQVSKEAKSSADIGDVSEKIIKLVSIAVREEFSGPLPHPRILRQYGSIVKGGANRIFTMAEKEQDLTIFDIKSQNYLQWTGMILMYLFCFSIVGLGFYLIVNDKPIQGFSSLGLGLLPLMIAYFTRKKGSKG
jgi:uncharacterized membrane protein